MARMNADTPTIDDLRKDLPRLRVMISELVGYYPHPGWEGERWITPTGNTSMRLDYLPDFPASHDACRTFEDAMSEEEFGKYCDALLRITAGESPDPQDGSYCLWPEGLRAFAKAKPVDRCIARLIVAGRIK